MPDARTAVATSAALLAWTQAGYGALLALLKLPEQHWPAIERGAEPFVSLIVAAYREEAVIAAKVRNALALDWPRAKLEVIVAVDGGADADADATAERARAAGADRVLELPRAGKHAGQNVAVRQARGGIVAFSDANAMWAPDALRALMAPLHADPKVGYVCGTATFTSPDGDNQEGTYWRYELWLRGRESRLYSVTAGNGAIYALRRQSYRQIDTSIGHDLTLPYQLVRRGWRAVYAPAATASEPMVPTIEGEWRRKRRMMRQAWQIVLRRGLLDPRGQPPVYLLALVSHRWLRYASPLLHLVALAAAPFARPRALWLAPQLALLAAAAAPCQARPCRLARYYVLTTASIGAGLYDLVRHGSVVGWEAAEGTR